MTRTVDLATAPRAVAQRSMLNRLTRVLDEEGERTAEALRSPEAPTRPTRTGEGLSMLMAVLGLYERAGIGDVDVEEYE